jgi:predicted helicase
MEEALQTFISDVARILNNDDYREETFYNAFEQLMRSAGEELEVRKLDVTTLPKKTDAGNPDFRIWDGIAHNYGYVEAKKPDADLDKIARSEQLQRYRNAFPNVILTDFFEYRLYKNGDLVNKVRIGRPFIATKLDETPPVEQLDEFVNLLEQFFAHSVPKTYRASSLAKELAKRTRFLEHVIEQDLLDDENQSLSGFYQAFQQYLISGLSKQEFADLYAQTVTYGLFAARTRAEGEFTRESAVDFIPATIGILKDVFSYISFGKLPENIRWIVDEIAEVLNAADINKILDRYYEDGKGKDPIIHFYETFLAKYDPQLRERRGVYYTPEPVVGYIVRSVHEMLKEDFDKPLGLADSSVTVLDPAAGTLTFIAEAFKVAVEEYKEHYGEGGIPELIKDHLLKHFYAFELMMAPYAIGHLKMGFILEELGYSMSDEERFRLYLTNTLEMEDLEQTELPGMASLSAESKAAGKIKKEEEVLVILGNPPYSGNSFNKGEWIDKLLKEEYTHENGHDDDGYYRVDGAPLQEHNPKMLQDDYVKFMRFAQWKIDQFGQGVVSMITNHGYLDNPTFKGMRESLIKSYDEIYLLDLHGNYRKKEYTDRRPNLNPEFYALLENTYGQRPTPEQILYYVYAVLYAPAYRQTYAEFLKSDFPRIPFTKDYELFQEMAALGHQITELHLMESDQLNKPIAKFQGKGSNVIAKAKKVGRNYQPEEQRVYINKDGQYFEGIPQEVWEYQIGGYQVLDKWLYDRRERHLTNEEIQHYCRVVTALKHTIDLQQQIDEIHPGVEEETITW